MVCGTATGRCWLIKWLLKGEKAGVANAWACRLWKSLASTISEESAYCPFSELAGSLCLACLNVKGRSQRQVRTRILFKNNSLSLIPSHSLPHPLLQLLSLQTLAAVRALEWMTWCYGPDDSDRHTQQNHFNVEEGVLKCRKTELAGASSLRGYF